MKKYKNTKNKTIQETRIVSNNDVRNVIDKNLNDAIDKLTKKFDMSKHEAVKSIIFYLNS